jgi:hypothetical protein
MFTPQERRARIDKIRRLPAQLEALVSPLTPSQLTTPYLAGEWTVAQNVHHLADSHINSYIRMRLMLTEDHPTLKPYDQEVWATLPDAGTPDLQSSLAILRGLHHRWVQLFESLQEDDWARAGLHPEVGEITVEDILRIYSDHCDAHLDQITRTLAAGAR